MLFIFGFSKTQNDEKIYDVIIIGAGISGLAAADYLIDDGNDVLVLEARGDPLGNTKKFFNQSHHRYFFENTLELIMIKYGWEPFLTTKYPITGPTRQNTIYCLGRFKGESIKKNFKKAIKFGKKETFDDIFFKLKYYNYLAKNSSNKLLLR